MVSRVLFLASYVIASMFMLIVLTSHPEAKDVFINWWTWYIPVAFITGMPLGYILYRGLCAVIGD